jgi:RNase H-fold protein (predicted Holliday junction resolvase)
MAKYIIAYVISCSLFCWLAYDYGATKGNLKVAIVKKEITENYNTQLKEQIVKAQILQKELTLTKLNKENEIYNLNKRHSAVVNSLRNRPERTTTVFKDRNTTTECSGAASTGEQLFREDAEFLIGEATKAMILRESLTSCRRYLLEINQQTKD